ncbi:MAG: TIGR00269 family protein [Candidatus Methanomethylicia archaeon]|nr:TIGR00269 family protein [Candidatus Methanomethylicia archaeon]MDW7988628.1 TIGR00269 family protein [Nitrososphaerota archaeon]
MIIKYCGKCHVNEAKVHVPYMKVSLCPKCFKEFYINRLKRTIEDYRMFKDSDLLAIAVSGGKDSAALLHALKQAYQNVKMMAIHVNLGIKDYSDDCERKVRMLTEELNVELYVYDLKKELEISIDDFKKTKFRNKICSVCGTIKRHIFDEITIKIKANVLVTGHNMDDIITFMLSNFLSQRWDLLVKMKPVLPPLTPNIPIKVKPLIKTSSIENMLYCIYSNIPFVEEECPYTKGAVSLKTTKLIEDLAKEAPNIKYQILSGFLNLIPMIERKIEREKFIPCEKCGFPSANGLCAYCKRVELVKKIKFERK